VAGYVNSGNCVTSLHACSTKMSKKIMVKFPMGQQLHRDKGPQINRSSLQSSFCTNI